MKINRALWEFLSKNRNNQYVEDVRIGLGYTAVKLENGQVGLANTLVQESWKSCTKFKGDFFLKPRRAFEVLEFLESSDVVKIALGLATANALSNTWSESMRSGDILEDISLGPRDKVAMVGSFAPMISKLRKKVEQLYIFERISREQEGLIPVEQAPEILPGCQVFFITSTSIINATLDELLSIPQGCREVVMLGASTPLVPEVFKNTPVTQLSGILVPQPETLIKVVSCGGGMQVFKSIIQKVNLSVG